MRALTLHRPWDFAMAHGGKDIENRPWKPWPSVVGARIALHAGMHYDDGGAGYIDSLLGLGKAPTASQSRGGFIVATTRIEGWVHEDGSYFGVPPEVAREARRSRWFMGPFGWICADTRPLHEPVPCRGAQGLWAVPIGVETRVLLQERRA
jgi:hypothetical protein